MRFGRSFVLLCLLILLAACQANNPLALPTDTPAPATPTNAPTASPTPGPDTIAGFDRFLTEAEARKPDQRQELVNRFMGSLARAPITGGEEAIFLYQGAAQTVQIVGDMNNWDRDQASGMMRLEGSDLWYQRSAFEADARLDYRFLVDGGDAVLDRLNGSTIPGPTGPNSELRMPAYRPPPELGPLSQPAPAGTITFHTVQSQILGQTRTLQVYEPAGQIVGQRLPLLFVNGGSDYLNLIDAPAILDRLIALRRIPPLLVVFVTPINAEQEYLLNDAYAAFLAEEAVPDIQRTFATSAEPMATGILGSGLGGVAAVHTWLAYPQVFGRAAAQSGRFSLAGGALVEPNNGQTRLAGAQGSQVYLVAGTYETAIAGENILQSNRQLAGALEEAGVKVDLDERPQGHSWGLWQATLGDALAALFGPAP